MSKAGSRILQGAKQALAFAKGADVTGFRIICNEQEDTMALALKQKTPAITHEEMERRRKMVRSAFRSNAMEGLRPNPACQPVFDAFIAGEIELDEMMPRVKSILGVQ